MGKKKDKRKRYRKVIKFANRRLDDDGISVGMRELLMYLKGHADAMLKSL